MPKPPKETDLYAPLRDYLVRQGYTVRGEVKDCDIAATRGDDLIVVELKRHLSIGLLVQATQRQKLTDSVYVAVPRSREMGHGRKWRQTLHLLRRLELGLILVSFSVEPPHVEIVGHPTPLQRRRQPTARRAVLTEMAERSGDHNQGGSSRRKLVTAYREQAIRIAVCLQARGPSAPKALRELGTGPKTTAILHANHYGWFDHVGRACYALNATGVEALAQYATLADSLRKALPPSAEGE